MWQDFYDLDEKIILSPMKYLPDNASLQILQNVGRP